MKKQKRRMPLIGHPPSKTKNNTEIIIRYRSPLRKIRTEALLRILRECDRYSLLLNGHLFRELYDFGWNIQAINTAANDLARQGVAVLKHAGSPGMFRLVLASSDAEGNGEATKA